MQTPKLLVLRQAMSAYALRSQALADNVANLDTPGFERRAVRFEEQLQRYRKGLPADRDAGRLDARVVTEDGPPLLEDELMSLADTQMRTQLTTRALSEYFDTLRTGITGRSA